MAIESVTVRMWTAQGEVGIGAEQLEQQLAFLDRPVERDEVVLLQAIPSETGPDIGWAGQPGNSPDVVGVG